MRRRMITEEGQSKYPFYSDYPTITEYGVYLFDSQSDSTSIENVFLKMDDTSYNWCGGGPLNRDFYVEYTEDGLTAYIDAELKQQWFRREQESSSFSLKRCSGVESAPALVVFKVDKIS